jgi:homocysteine S-methyltransferase
MLDAPDAVRAVHASYLEAGADCITTAGYQASFEGFSAVGLDRSEGAAALRLASQLAVEAKRSFWSNPGNRIGRLEPIVAASAGPYGAYRADGSEYDGRYGVTKDVLKRFHADRLDVLCDGGADVIAFETIPSLLEAEVLADLLEGRKDAVAWVSFSCRDSSTLRDGTPISDAVRTVVDVDALVGVGVNCTAPGHIVGLMDRIRSVTDLPLVVYPNSGEAYDAQARTWVGPRAEWLDDIGEWVRSGAAVIGGCCRIGPAEIRELRLRLEEIHAL